MTARHLARLILPAALTFALALTAAHADIAPHPVIGWKGNEFLFEVSRESGGTRLVAYRAQGSRWARVGTTLIEAGQRAPKSGFLQQIWFKGRRMGTLSADMTNPFWRVYPSQERSGKIIP